MINAEKNQVPRSQNTEIKYGIFGRRIIVEGAKNLPERWPYADCNDLKFASEVHEEEQIFLQSTST